MSRKDRDHKLRAQIASMPCSVKRCRAYYSDCAHIKTVGSGRPDALWNMLSLCRKHHMEQEGKWQYFLEDHPEIAALLKKLGWSWEIVNSKFVMYHKELQGK